MVYYKNILFLKSQYQLKSNLGKSSEFSHTRILMLLTILGSFLESELKSNDVQNTDNTQKPKKIMAGI